jgi:hypothetical protein
MKYQYPRGQELEQILKWTETKMMPRLAKLSRSKNYKNVAEELKRSAHILEWLECAKKSEVMYR